MVVKKNGQKKTGRGLLVALGCFVVFTLVGALSDPSAHDGTWAAKDEPVPVDAEESEDVENGEQEPEEDDRVVTNSDIVVDGETIYGFYDVM